jgi:hypothetical protein
MDISRAVEKGKTVFTTFRIVNATAEAFARNFRKYEMPGLRGFSERRQELGV